MKLFTIGFTRKSAQNFLTSLTSAGVKRLVDVRLNNVSQLAGFAKTNDLRYFTRTICRIDYIHVPALAPTADILDAYKKPNQPTGPNTSVGSSISCNPVKSKIRPANFSKVPVFSAARISPTTAIAAWSRSIYASTGATSKSNTSPNSS